MFNGFLQLVMFLYVFHGFERIFIDYAAFHNHDPLPSKHVWLSRSPPPEIFPANLEKTSIVFRAFLKVHVDSCGIQAEIIHIIPWVVQPPVPQESRQDCAQPPGIFNFDISLCKGLFQIIEMSSAFIWLTVLTDASTAAGDALGVLSDDSSTVSNAASAFADAYEVQTCQ